LTKSSALRESKEVALDGAEVIGSTELGGLRDGVEDLDVGVEGPDDEVEDLGVGVEGPDDGVKDLGVGVEGPDDEVEDLGDDGCMTNSKESRWICSSADDR
jgi:hypothetical protein